MSNFFFPKMHVRSNELEMMDLADCNQKKLINTIKQFSLVNRLLTRSHYFIKKYLIPLMNKRDMHYTFLDVGAGGCDLMIWLSKICRIKKINITITCIDYDERIIEYAQKQCQNYSNIIIKKRSAFELDSQVQYDFIFSNHFLHHIPDNKIVSLLSLLSKKTKIAIILNDLRRSNLAYLGYTIFAGILLHNSYAFYDGRLSIKRGFLQDELIQKINQTIYHNNYSIIKKEPARIALIGKFV